MVTPEVTRVVFDLGLHEVEVIVMVPPMLLVLVMVVTFPRRRVTLVHGILTPALLPALFMTSALDMNLARRITGKIRIELELLQVLRTEAGMLR